MLAENISNENYGCAPTVKVHRGPQTKLISNSQLHGQLPLTLYLLPRFQDVVASVVKKEGCMLYRITVFISPPSLIENNLKMASLYLTLI